MRLAAAASATGRHRRARRRKAKEDHEAGGSEGESYLCCLHHEGMTRMPEEYNGGAKADDQGRGMTRLIAAPRADD